MAINRRAKKRSYGLSNALQNLYPLPIITDHAPTTSDSAEIGTIWLDQTGNDVYILMEIVAANAVWVAIGAGAVTFDSVTSTTFVNAGTTVTAGTGLIATTGAVTCSDWTTYGVVINDNAGLMATQALTNGQLIIGSTGAAVAAATLTAGAGINIANGAGTITITATGATAVQYTCDDANVVVPDGLGNVNVLTTAGGNIATVGAVANTIGIGVVANPTFTGLVTCQLGVDVSGANVVLTSATNTGDDIYLHANGGIAETIRLHADQGTGADSVHLESDVGGITLTSTALAGDNAITLASVAGGVDIDAAMQINIQGTENTTDSIVVYATNGGIDITSDGDGATNENIDITATSAINLTSSYNAGQCIYIRENAGAGGTIDIHADQGTAATSINLHSDVGGITLASGLGTADAINIDANVAGAGGFDLDAGTQGIICDTTGAISLDGILASNFTVTGAGIDLTLASVGGSVNIDGSEAAADAVSINASDGAGGVTIAAGTGGLLFGNQADCTTIQIGDFAPTATRNITVGGGTIITAAVTDTIDIGPDGATTNANSIKTVTINNGGVAVGEVLTHIATGAITSGTHTVNIQTGNAAAGTVATNVSTGTGTKTVNVGNADANTTVNIDAVTLINDSVNANVSICTGTSTGAIAVGNALAGAVTVDTAAGISLDGATASNFTVTGAGEDLTLYAVGGSIDINASEAAANAIIINASDAAGGIDVDCGTGGINIAAANGPVALTSGTGQVDISADATATTVNVGTGAGVKAVTVGSTNTTSITAIECGTLGLTLGTTANEHTTQIGSATTASAISIFSGTGLASFAANATDHTTVLGSVTGTSATTVQGGSGALNITSTSGTITMNAGAGTIAISDDAAAATLNIGTGGAAKAVTIGSANTTSSVAINSGTGDITLTSTDDITLDATGDLSLDAATVDLNATGGALSATPATATVAGTSLTCNARLGVCTFTGQTTGSGVDLDLDITNSYITPGIGVLVTVNNEGTNDADLTIEGVNTQTNGHLILHLINSGPAALNGNCTVTFWVIN